MGVTPNTILSCLFLLSVLSVLKREDPMVCGNTKSTEDVWPNTTTTASNNNNIKRVCGQYPLFPCIQHIAWWHGPYARHVGYVLKQCAITYFPALLVCLLSAEQGKEEITKHRCRMLYVQIDRREAHPSHKHTYTHGRAVRCLPHVWSREWWCER